MTREEAIKILKRDNPNNITIRDGYEKLFDDRKEAFGMAIKALEQEPKTGHWIKAKPWMIDNTSYKWECSECEKSERFRHNYCPKCGARMIEL